MGRLNKGQEVFTTWDYDMFKIMEGNRDFERHGKKLMESVERWGIISPIIVNENMEVIDGQGRLYAAKEVGVSVPYIIKKDLGIETCIEMNTTQTGWSYKDYIKSYADQGNENYVILRDALEEFPKVPVKAIWFALSGSPKSENSVLKSGLFQVYPTHRNIQLSALSFLEKIAESDIIYNNIPGRKYLFFSSILYALGLEGMSKKRMKKCLETYIQNKAVFIPFTTEESSIRSIEKVYNYHVKGPGKINLTGYYKDVKFKGLTWFGKPKLSVRG